MVPWEVITILPEEERPSAQNHDLKPVHPRKALLDGKDNHLFIHFTAILQLSDCYTVLRFGQKITLAQTLQVESTSLSQLFHYTILESKSFRSLVSPIRFEPIVNPITHPVGGGRPKRNSTYLAWARS